MFCKSREILFEHYTFLKSNDTAMIDNNETTNEGAGLIPPRTNAPYEDITQQEAEQFLRMFEEFQHLNHIPWSNIGQVRAERQGYNLQMQNVFLRRLRVSYFHPTNGKPGTLVFQGNKKAVAKIESMFLLFRRGIRFDGRREINQSRELTTRQETCHPYRQPTPRQTTHFTMQAPTVEPLNIPQITQYNVQSSNHPIDDPLADEVNRLITEWKNRRTENDTTNPSSNQPNNQSVFQGSPLSAQLFISVNDNATSSDPRPMSPETSNSCSSIGSFAMIDE